MHVSVCVCLPCKMVARKTNSLKSRTLRVLCSCLGHRYAIYTHKQRVAGVPRREWRKREEGGRGRV